MILPTILPTCVRALGTWRWILLGDNNGKTAPRDRKIKTYLEGNDESESLSDLRLLSLLFRRSYHCIQVLTYVDLLPSERRHGNNIK